MFYWDIDGVLRELDQLTLGKTLPYWDYKQNGKSFVQLVDENIEICELASPYQDYLDILNSCFTKVNILTHQPNNWKPYTEKWLNHYIKIPYNLYYVNNIKEKEKFLRWPNDYLIDDYPLFSNYENILLINREWNKNVEAPMRIHNGEMLKDNIDYLKKIYKMEV
jgi:hypothetical protein